MSSSNQNPKPLNTKESQHDPFSALRFRDFRLFTLGRSLLFVGLQMQSVAIGWELYERSHSAIALGGVGLAQVLPIISLTLVTGHVADRGDRQRISLISTLLLGLCSLALTVISWHQSSIFFIYACLLLSGAARAFIRPASDALMWGLIPKTAFTNAATWNSTSFQLAAVLGPALGGMVIAVLHSATWVYLLAAMGAIFCFLFLAIIKPQKSDFAKEPTTLKTLAAGAEFVWNNQLILAAITLDLFAVLLGGAVSLLPVFAKDILQVGPMELGYLQAAPSIGSLFIALILVYLPPFRQSGLILLMSVAGFGIVTIIFGLSHWFWLSLLMLVFSGVLDGISVVIRHTLVQIKTPENLRGRVAAINSLFISASNELGGFESGLTAALFGPVLSVVGGGIGTIIVVIATMAIWPEIRKLGALQE